MVKKSNLAEAFQKVILEKTNEVRINEIKDVPQKVTSVYVPPSRKGKLAITGSYDPEVRQQLKRIAVDNNTTIQKLVCEALNDLFIKYHKSPIAK